MGGFVRVTIKDPHTAELNLGKKKFVIRYHPETIEAQLRLFGLRPPFPQVRFILSENRGPMGQYFPNDGSIGLFPGQIVLEKKLRVRSVSALPEHLSRILIHELRHAWQHQHYGWLLWPGRIFGIVVSLVVYMAVMPKLFLDTMWSTSLSQEENILNHYMNICCRAAYYSQWHEIDARFATWRVRHENIWRQAFSVEPIP